jgi:membrane protease YdiL (CAAX protease family)
MVDTARPGSALPDSGLPDSALPGSALPGSSPLASALPGSSPPGRPQALTDAAVGVVLAIVCVLVVGVAVPRFAITDGNVVLLLSYLAVWVPLVGAVVAAGFLGGSWGGIRALAHSLGLRIRPLDLLWGLTIGVLARVVASVLEIALYGRMATGGAVLGVPVHDGWWVFGALLAPVLLAPVLEEVFFRGLVLRAVAGATERSGGAGGGGAGGAGGGAGAGGSRAVSLGIAVVVSGAVFALVHVLQAGSVSEVAVVGLSTFVFGVGAGVVAALTGRVGGAVVAHVTFNALVVVPAVLGW